MKDSKKAAYNEAFSMRAIYNPTEMIQAIKGQTLALMANGYSEAEAKVAIALINKIGVVPGREYECVHEILKALDE